MSLEENATNDGADHVEADDQLDQVFSVEESLNAGSDAELEKLQEENAELKDRLLRSQAEFENFRRRMQKESLDAMKYQALPVVRDILPGFDNLKRAIDAAEQSGDTQNLIEGIKMVSQQFQETLKGLSCEAINPEGEAFDPNLHEALTQVPSADHEPMTVLQVVEAGYRMHDRVIRPAKVIVSSALAPAPEANPEASE